MSSMQSFQKQEKCGVCYLVGAGPGDIGLTTLRAKEVIESCDVLVYDYLANPVLLSWAKRDCEKLYVGKKAGDHTLPQEKINTLIVRLCQQGKNVVRLKGGDSFVFGRGGEEAEELAAANVPFEVVPGVTSGIAAPAYAGIPVTHRDYNAQLTFVTGHEDPDKESSSVDWGHLAKTPGTLVFYMAVGRLPQITAALIAGGKDKSTPVALIRWGTMSAQEELVGTLEDIAEKVATTGFKAPAITVIGEVVNCRKQLSWLTDAKPLLGKRVVVTRTREKASELSSKLRVLGAEVFELPTISTMPPTDKEQFHELVADVHRYDWLLFTSPTGVDRFFESFFTQYDDARSIGGVRIAVVGPATAKRVRANHLAVDLMPEKAVAEELIEAMAANGSLDNLAILWVRPEDARDVVREALEERNAIVDEAIAYKTEKVTEVDLELRALLKQGEVDWITFASSSAVESFSALDLPLPARVKLASIGPITSQSIRQCGLQPSVEAENHHIEGLIQALIQAEQ